MVSPGFKTGAPCHESTSAWMCEQTDGAAYAGGMVEEKDVGGGLSDMTLMEERMQLRGSGNDKRFWDPACAPGRRFLTARQRREGGTDGRLREPKLFANLWKTVWTSRGSSFGQGSLLRALIPIFLD